MKTKEQEKIEDYLFNNQKRFSDRYIAERRYKALAELCHKENWILEDVGEKPNARAGETRMINNRIRVYLRYGLGRYNYAPAVEINQ